MPLNDDRQEKANRRHARQEAERNSMRAAGTPARNSRLSQIIAQDSPHTPSQDQDVDMPDVAGTAVTPMKRVMPLLANFEEWIKMATDNKINANNSWNFALIDYFHEMSLLKDGDGVNFQKASCTLDGCVKIYTSRVDSVATDTGKLLSGLAENATKKRRGAAEEGDEGDDDDEEEGEDGQKKRKKRAARSAQSTLATYEQLQNKKMDLELGVDPLFKKASADFDEGGAKGLLLNHLAIDTKGRIVFDSSDDKEDATAEEATATSAPEDTADQVREEDIEIDISALASKYFPDLSRLDEQDICPSMKTFDLGDVNGSMDLPFLKAAEEWRNEDDQNAAEEDGDEGNRSGLVLDSDSPMNYDDDDDDGQLNNINLPDDIAFGEGGEVWAQEAMRDPQARVHIMGHGDGEADDGEGTGEEGADFGLGMQHGREQEQENILSYFDQALKKNWAGPEHWRIQRVKQAGKVAPTTKRKEKEPFEIDFAAPMTQSMADMLYTQASSNSTISLTKAQRISKTRNLLPDDKHFSSKELLKLFYKPKARIGSRREGRRAPLLSNNAPDLGEVDEAYWANREGQEGAGADEAVEGNYDADFYQDDGLPFAGGPMDDDDDFADARDHFSPPPQDGIEVPQTIDGVVPSSQAEGAYGTQLVTQGRRFRPEYVQYARVAKKVDVKRLKDELWTGIGLEGVSRLQSCTIVDCELTTSSGESTSHTRRCS